MLEIRDTMKVVENNKLQVRSNSQKEHIRSQN